jgi:hypothetical protein
VNALTLPARQLSSRGPGNHTPDPAGGRLLRLTWGGTRRFIGRLLTGCALARYPAYSAARSKVTTSNDDVLLASKRRRHSDPTEASAQPGAGILPPPFRSFTRAAVSHCGPLQRAWKSAAFLRRAAASGLRCKSADCWRRPAALSAQASPSRERRSGRAVRTGSPVVRPNLAVPR